MGRQSPNLRQFNIEALALSLRILKDGIAFDTFRTLGGEA
jgi:hypothetical protein